MNTIGNFFKDVITDNSNRGKHFAGGILCGFCLTILFAVGLGIFICGMLTLICA